MRTVWFLLSMAVGLLVSVAMLVVGLAGGGPFILAYYLNKKYY